MKKSFLIFGVIGAIYGINGWAAGNKSMVAVYTCPDNCFVNNNENTFTCAYNDGKSCGNATANVFIPQTPDANVNLAMNGQIGLEAIPARTNQVSARAAKKQNTTTSNKPKSSTQDSAAGGSGYEQCPPPCSFHEFTRDDGIVTHICLEPDGRTECNSVVKGVATVTARAAKRQNPTSNKPKPSGPDKVHSEWEEPEECINCKAPCTRWYHNDTCTCACPQLNNEK